MGGIDKRKEGLFSLFQKVIEDPETIEELRFLEASGVPIFEGREMSQSEIESEREKKRLEEIIAMEQAGLEPIVIESTTRRDQRHHHERVQSKWPDPIDPDPPTPIERIRARMEIDNKLAEDGKIDAAEHARRDLISRSTMDELQLGVPQIEFNGRSFSGAELTAYLEIKKSEK